jgi:hypothetical protein
MKYEDLEEVNKELATVDIKGKAYVQVNTRVVAFRKLFPMGCITTDIVSHEKDDKGVSVVVMKATVTDELGTILGTGYAFEKETSSFINKTSYIENCETSAVGRALAMVGIGTDASMCSAEELVNAINNQNKTEDKKAEAEQKKIENSVISKAKANALLARCEKDGVEPDKIVKLYKVGSISDLTEIMYSNLNKNWDKVKEA